MPYALPPAPPAIVQYVPTTTARQATTRTAAIAIPIHVPAYEKAARKRGWPFTTTRADAKAVARAILNTVRRDGAHVTRVDVVQARNRSNVAWMVTTNATARDAEYFRMRVVLNRNGRGMLSTVGAPVVACCGADPSRGGIIGQRKRSW